MMAPKSKFLFKFPINKKSFVNFELFKSLKLTKDMAQDKTNLY
jgi:hypothetical protein